MMKKSGSKHPRNVAIVLLNKTRTTTQSLLRRRTDAVNTHIH